jgi:hypothetical protein
MSAVWGLGMLIVVLGLTHCVVAPILMNSVLSVLLPGDAHVVLYMVLATGVATTFAGWLIILAAGGMRRRERLAWSLAWWTTLFLVILGAGAVVTMFDNPFAHIMLVTDILLIIAVARSQIVPREEPKDEWPR